MEFSRWRWFGWGNWWLGSSLTRFFFLVHIFLTCISSFSCLLANLVSFAHTMGHSGFRMVFPLFRISALLCPGCNDIPVRPMPAISFVCFFSSRSPRPRSDVGVFASSSYCSGRRLGRVRVGMRDIRQDLLRSRSLMRRAREGCGPFHSAVVSFISGRWHLCVGSLVDCLD